MTKGSFFKHNSKNIYFLVRLVEGNKITGYLNRKGDGYKERHTLHTHLHEEFINRHFKEITLTYDYIKYFSAPYARKKYFFAFDNKQLDEGKKAKNFIDADEILSGGMGLYGTKTALDELFYFHRFIDTMTYLHCDPQEAYVYHFWNYECEYVGNDSRAWEETKATFREKAEIVKRKYAWSD